MLHERIRDHTINPNSAIRQHHVDTGHPLPNSDDRDVKILSVEPNGFKRRVKEAIFIKTNNPELNQNIGKYNLPPIYDQLLTRGGGQDKLFIQKQVKKTIPKLKIRKDAIGKHYHIVRD